MPQLILHLLGDYILQSNWMASYKSSRSWPCFLHCLTYTIPFLLLTRSPAALAVIFGTHFLLDRFGLARYLVWLKEWQGPYSNVPFAYCQKTGYYDPEVEGLPRLELIHTYMEKPLWLRMWLTVVADNTLHLACNALAIAWL